MSRSCAPWRGDIGAYVVGALDARARDRVARHLEVCPGCRADYDELVPVRDWLGLPARAIATRARPEVRLYTAWPATCPCSYGDNWPPMP